MKVEKGSGVESCSIFEEHLGGKGSLSLLAGTEKPAITYRRLSLPVKPNHLLKLSTGAVLQVELCLVGVGAEVRENSRR